MAVGDCCDRDKDRARIVVFVNVFLPGYKSGGPIRSIQAMTEIFGDEFSFSIVSFDRDSGDGVPYPGCETMTWLERSGYRITYVPKQMGMYLRVWRLSRDTAADVIYLQSMFNPLFTWVPLLAFRLGLSRSRRCLIAPRGEFYPGALGIRPLRKRAFIFAARLIGLYRGCDWHASSFEEAEQIQKQMGVSMDSSRGRIFVASDLVPVGKGIVPGFECREGNGSGDRVLRVVFLSRLAPKKNLDFAIEALKYCHERVRFCVFGPSDQDPDYWSMCKAQLKGLPVNVEAEYCGIVLPHEVPGVFRSHDLFLFPTKGENFGHVIAESFLAGCPVLTSDRTPWRGLKNEGVGWDLPLDDAKAFGYIVDQVAKMPTRERREQRRRAVEFARKRVNSAQEIQRNLQMFRALVDDVS